MKKLTYAAIAAGVLFGVGVGFHALLVHLAERDGAWSPRAAATCASCHGG